MNDYFTIYFVFLIETKIVLSKFNTTSLQVSLSVILVAIGVIIAGLGDFSFDLFGYSMALTSVFFQVKEKQNCLLF